jgi:hypothetical protein
MQIKPGKFCPLIQKDCVGLECNWFIQVRGTNPNTGQAIDEWGCSIAWLPVLLIENSQQQRQTGAAVESFRNEMVKQNEQTNKFLISAASSNLIQIENVSNRKEDTTNIHEIE